MINMAFGILLNSSIKFNELDSLQRQPITQAEMISCDFSQLVTVSCDYTVYPLLQGMFLVHGRSRRLPMEVGSTSTGSVKYSKCHQRTGPPAVPAVRLSILGGSSRRSACIDTDSVPIVNRHFAVSVLENIAD